jgi:hypothetical protein
LGLGFRAQQRLSTKGGLQGWSPVPIVGASTGASPRGRRGGNPVAAGPEEFFCGAAQGRVCACATTYVRVEMRTQFVDSVVQDGSICHHLGSSARAQKICARIYSPSQQLKGDRGASVWPNCHPELSGSYRFPRRDPPRGPAGHFCVPHKKPHVNL